DMDPLWVNIRREFNLSSFSRAGGIEKRTGVAVSSLFETAIAIPLFLVGLAWFNGVYTKMLDFSMAAEKKLELKRGKQFSKERNPKEPGAKRKKELRKDKITLACELMGRAAKNGYAPDYALVDSWYTCAQVINKARSINEGKTHFLGMVRRTKDSMSIMGGNTLFPSCATP
ncbi:MAG: hypothetical protein WAX69_19905, partial [Victivallales bacterium]